MSSITCKFGGTSLASAAMMRRAAAIVDKNPRRRFVVPSAPGKRTPDDRKVTDLLLTWHAALKNDLDPSQPIAIVTQRFSEIASELGVKFDIRKEIEEIGRAAKECNSSDFLASRGEYLNARIMAELMGARFVDPAELIRFDYEGRLDESTYEILGDALRGDGRFVVPGFYGADPDGRIKCFSRGGSDVTGSIVARAAGCELYENWTDVDGIRMTDPRIVPYARRIDEITYGELRELAYMGASVIHDEAIFPVQKAGISMNIRNTMDPESPGTMIVAERVATQPVCGVAAKRGFTMINIEKTMMNREVGLARRALSILEEHRVSFEHMPTSIDSISLIIRDEELKQHGLSIVTGIDRVCQPDRVWLTPGIALIATVGEGMSHHIGVAARLCSALAQARVNLRVLDQGASETNIIIGVNEDDMDSAVRAIYDAFENWK